MKTDRIMVLVHGFIKNSKDMRTLASFFNQYYDDIVSIDLPTTFVGMDVAVERLCQVIQNIPNSKSITFLAHSMGGIIVCKSIHKLQLENIEKCIFIATPFRGSKIADFGDKIPFYSRILKPNKELKVTDKYLNICNSVSAKFPVGLIAGKRHSRFNLLARFCLNEEHDGLVEVESVFAINNSDKIILDKNHGEIHHDAETLEKVNNFLKTGTFG